jgi:hypothetical protein
MATRDNSSIQNSPEFNPPAPPNLHHNPTSERILALERTLREDTKLSLGHLNRKLNHRTYKMWVPQVSWLRPGIPLVEADRVSIQVKQISH